MENRHSKRLNIKINILLYHHNVPVAHCVTKNISTDGMFIESGPLVYQNDTILKVEFNGNGTNKGIEFYSLPAMIVHNAKNGLGLLLPGDQSGPMLAWREMFKKVSIKNSINKIDSLLVLLSRS